MFGIRFKDFGIDRCAFENNIATLEGGSIGFADQIGNVFIRDSHFTANKALRGGAIYGYTSWGSVERCTFRRNIAEEYPTIDIPYSNLNFIDNDFDDGTGNGNWDEGGGKRRA
jgi:hypothetical protein